MSDSTPSTTEPAESSVNRRRLLHGGAVLAGAAGAAVVSAVVAPSRAAAADGDPVVAGRGVTATSTTTLARNSTTGATLALQNSQGPSLYLEPLADTAQPRPLQVGQIVNTDVGPYIGVDYGDGPETTYLATGSDLLPVPMAISPFRALATRAGRAGVVGSSPGAFDAEGRLNANAWMDVAISYVEDGLQLDSVFVNVVASGPPRTGFLSVYPPGNWAGTSTLAFVTNQTISNQAFVPTVLVRGAYAIRVRASTATHIIVDVTGVTVIPSASGAVAAAAKSTASPKQGRGSSVVNRVRETLRGR